MTSFGARSSIVKICSMSSIPCSFARSISPRRVGQSWACSSPPTQRRAAAVRTAWRVPPMPIARWSFVPRTAAEIEAVTSPSWMSLIRAPAARISSIRSWWRGRSRTIVVTSATRRPNASAIASMFSSTGRLRSIFPRADGHLAHVHVRQGLERAGIAGRDHGHGPACSPSNDARALERIEREIGRLAPHADPHSGGELLGVFGGADHDLAVDRQLLESLLHTGAGRLLRPGLIRAAQPTGTGERRTFGDARVALAQTEPGGTGLGVALFADELRHQTFWSWSAADRTSSMTSEVAPSRSRLAITGTPSFSARSTM